MAGFHHLGLTVRDIAASEAWYIRVLGLVRVSAEPHGIGDGCAVAMTCPGTGLFVGLDHHPGADREMFSARRTGWPGNRTCRRGRSRPRTSAEIPHRQLD